MLSPEEQARTGPDRFRYRAPAACTQEECEGFNFFAVGAGLIQREPFYAAMMRRLKRLCTLEVKTACAGYDARDDAFYIAFNPKFMNSLPVAAQVFIVVHEICHIMWRHVLHRSKEPHWAWNIATDSAINSMLLESGYVKPPCGIFPGFRPEIEDVKTAVDATETKSKEQVEIEGILERLDSKLADIIASWPGLQYSDWYFERLVEAFKDDEDYAKLQSLAACGAGYSPAGEGSDDHGTWGTNDPAGEDRLNGRINQIVSQAIADADSRSDAWGTVPQSIREELRASCKNAVDWRTLLKQFFATVTCSDKRGTFSRINRRYPLLAPGKKRDRLPRVLIAIDESGSMDNNWVQMIFAAVYALNKRVDVDICVFDAAVHLEGMRTLKRGETVELERVACGGTDFNAPTQYVNGPDCRQPYDAMLIATDGCAPAPEPSRVPRGWIIVPGCKLHFDTNEPVVSMSDARDWNTEVVR